MKRGGFGGNDVRRKDREITDLAEMRSILEQADVCHLALSDENRPYLVTMNFGLRWDSKLVLYFHTASEGKKLDILKKNNAVCFGADIDHELRLSPTGTSCGCSMRYRSVVGTGRISFITDCSEKWEALEAIMSHYAGHTTHRFTEEMVDRTTILRLDVEEITGKRRA